MTAASAHYPQASCMFFTKSLQNEWSFVQRVLLGFEIQFSMHKEVLRNELLSTLLGLNLLDKKTM